jgi:hypothetical protein
VTPPCRPSPLFLSAYKSDPKPPLTPPTPPQHLSSSTSRCSSPPLLTIAAHHPSPWTAIRRPSPHEVRAGIGPPRPPLYFPPLPGCCHAPGGRRPWPGRPPPTVPLPLLFCLEEEERQTCAKPPPLFLLMQSAAPHFMRYYILNRFQTPPRIKYSLQVSRSTSNKYNSLLYSLIKALYFPFF